MVDTEEHIRGVKDRHLISTIVTVEAGRQHLTTYSKLRRAPVGGPDCCTVQTPYTFNYKHYSSYDEPVYFPFPVRLTPGTGINFLEGLPLFLLYLQTTLTPVGTLLRSRDICPRVGLPLRSR